MWELPGLPGIDGLPGPQGLKGEPGDGESKVITSLTI